jgi:nucleotide-binding universal stress UspA family protein
MTTLNRPLRVIVAIDGSEPANVAVELTANIAWPPDSKIAVVEAVDSYVALLDGSWPAMGTISQVQVEQIENDERAEAQRLVAAARERLARPGLDVQDAVVRGRAASGIIDRAEATQADLIVIGSRGHGAIESMVFGSVSAEVVDHAHGAVLVARSKQIERIVLAWDGSACAERAVELLRSWPIFADSTVRVVSVADIGFPWWAGMPGPGTADLVPLHVEAANASRERHKELARELAAELRIAGFNAEAEWREGDPAT